MSQRTRQLERLTTELQNQLDGKTEALEKSQQEVLALKKFKAISNKRQHLMLDLHDEIGGHLISAISVVEMEQGSDSNLYQILTSAMQELRIVTDTLDSEENDLMTVLAMFRQRIEPVLNSQNIQLIWSVESEPYTDNFNPSKSFNLIRIVEKAFAEIIKYENTSVVTMAINKNSIQVHSNGNGQLNKIIRGRVMDGIRAKAKYINAELTLNHSAQGLSLTLSW